MNMKKEIKTKTLRDFCKCLAGVLLSVSVFVLPVTVYAEAAQQPAEVAQAKYIMPQEQVYLDPSQTEAAKKQKEADAKYNSEPQNSTAAVAETQVKPEAGQAKNSTAQQPAEVSQAKYVMPQEQVYLDPSQIEAAKQQKAEDAFYNSQPQTKNVEVVTGDRVIADVKVVEQDNKANLPVTENTAETKKAEEINSVTVQPEKAEPEKPASAVTKEVKEAKPETPKAAAEKVTREEKTSAAVAENKNEDKIETLEGQPVLQQKPVRLHHFGLAKEITTHHATVGEVLQEMKINMEGRSVYPAPETRVTDGMVIHVLARKSFLSREEVEVPFGTQVINDPELAFGTKKVEKEGVKGKDLVIYENITRPGHAHKIELDRRRVAEPVNEIVRQGVAQSVLTPEGYVRYKKKIIGEATAYTWGGGATGHTSVGLWPKRGIVAVDPRVIPYYTKLYIPGYGMALAADTGSAIVGTRIDLFMDSLHECFQWGRRDVEIYILE